MRDACVHHVIMLVAACGLAVVPARAEQQSYREPFRPQFHFTPERNWMNDPNGMVFHDGKYHLFYQYNPRGDKWGHMSWAHAVSRDLVRWEHLPLALPEDGDIMAFSGSAVVDTKNTAGFGQDALVAIYTGHNEKAKRQDQRLAYSTDGGRTWTQYSGNPVLDIGDADFRDPKVFWHEPAGAWIMAVAMSTEKKIRFYNSPDLKQWTQTGEFGPAGATGGLWECPDLFELPVDGGEKKWVLIVNINPGGPAGGSGCQYFVGDFDGKKFTTTSPPAGTDSSQDASPGDEGVILGDFEGSGYGDWTVKEGTAFAEGMPARPDAASDLQGFKGQGLADSFGGADEQQGVLASPDFVIDADSISFIIGGGNHPDQMGLKLVVDGQVVRSATGNDSPQLEQKSWDVFELRGKTAHLEIFDNYAGTDWGHIFVDHIVLGGGRSAASSGSPAVWADYGNDFYAAVTWSDIPSADGRRIMIGWMSNWQYADKVPTSPWRGAMTVPRALKLVRTPDGIRLAQEPVAELAGLREGAPKSFAGGSFADAMSWLADQHDLPELLDVEMTFSGVSGTTPFEVAVQTGAGEATVIGVRTDAGKISVDRTRSGATAFHPAFADRSEAPLQVVDGKLKLRMLLDTSSLEVFAQDGVSVLTNLIYPAAGLRSIGMSLAGSTAPHVDGIQIRQLSSSWTSAK